MIYIEKIFGKFSYDQPKKAILKTILNNNMKFSLGLNKNLIYKTCQNKSFLS